MGRGLYHLDAVCLSNKPSFQIMFALHDTKPNVIKGIFTAVYLSLYSRCSVSWEPLMVDVVVLVTSSIDVSSYCRIETMLMFLNELVWTLEWKLAIYEPTGGNWN